jgi:hypothetical protein
VEFVVESGNCRLQLFRLHLAGDRDRTHLIEGVVVHTETLKQAALDQAQLELRAWRIEYVREYIGGVCRRRILGRARSIPLNLENRGGDRRVGNDRSVALQ